MKKRSTSPVFNPPTIGLLLGMAFLGATPGVAQTLPSPAPSSAARSAPTTALISTDEMLALIRKHHINGASADLERVVREGAARGALVALNELQRRTVGGPRSGQSSTEGEDNPFSSVRGPNAFLGVDEFKLMKVEFEGKFAGVGLMLGAAPGVSGSGKNGPWTVLKALPGLPGDKAGLKSGDVIASVDSVSVTTMPLKDLVLKLRGLEGSTVKVGITRAGAPSEVTLIRKAIQIPSAELSRITGNRARINVREFRTGTTAELVKALDEARIAGAQSLVLDLRNNAGGLLDEAIACAKLFLSPGQVVARMRRRSEPAVEHKATAEPAWKGPMVVLVDRHTHCGAELVAGSLRDNGRALLVGEKTDGKGTAETLLELSSGHAVKITTMLFHLPGGVCPSGEGLLPDVPVVGAGHRETHGMTPGPGERAPTESEVLAADPALNAACRILDFKGH